MNHPSWRNRLSYISHFIPFRFYLLLFLAASAIALWWVNRQQPNEPSYYGAMLTLLVSVAITASLTLLALSFLTAFFPFLWFGYKIYRRKVLVNIDNAAEEGAIQTGRRITMEISPLWRPLLGFLYFRFIYDDIKRSPKFSLIRKKRSLRFFVSTQQGWYHWPLPAIREYEVQQMIVYFEDIFHFFSLSLRLPVKQSFFTKPRELSSPPQDARPHRTQEENVRIEELKRMEGEYLNYKNFEGNDDVRRIVWKIYARNKELVVRIPEILDPYASHIYLYVSFYDSLHMPENYLINTRGLDYFKNVSWSIYSQLIKQGRMVKLIPDQPLPVRTFANAQEQSAYMLAASNWQHQYDLLSTIPSKGHAVICISSLTSATQLDQLLQRQEQKTMLVMARLSKGIKRNMIGKWLKWIFVAPEDNYEKQGFTEIRRFATMRRMKANEAAIKKVVDKYGTTVLELN